MNEWRTGGYAARVRLLNALSQVEAKLNAGRYDLVASDLFMAKWTIGLDVDGVPGHVLRDLRILSDVGRRGLLQEQPDAAAAKEAIQKIRDLLV